jgi:threonine synthase
MNAPTQATSQVNPNWIGYRCIACHKLWLRSGIEVNLAQGCPDCRDGGSPANLRCEYKVDFEPEIESASSHSIAPAMPMPYYPTRRLGEGHTPLVDMPQGLGSANRLGNSDFFKLELANPTGSHKDRMAALAVADAHAQGKQTVMAASSGNAGVAIAAYAGLYGLRCAIAVTPDCPQLYLDLMRSYGATIVTCANSMQRWDYLAQYASNPEVSVATNFVVPAIGSPPVAIEAYKQIALELLQQKTDRSLGWGSIYIPVARGDLLWGIYMGFEHLRDTNQIKSIPRLVAVEPFARLSLVLNGASPQSLYEGQSLQSSISGNTITMQSVLALQRSGGAAIVVNDDDAIAARKLLAKNGFPFELCAAAAWAAFDREQRQPNVTQDVQVPERKCNVVIATSHGSRDAHLFK